MVNTVTTNLARGSQERHLSTHSASHLERQQPAGLIYPSLERRNYPELSCIGGLHPAGIPECMPSIYQAAGASVEADGQRSGRAVHQSVRSLLGFQFRPAPVLAKANRTGSVWSAPTSKSRESTQRIRTGSVMLAGTPAVHRTLAAGRIQFMSAWRKKSQSVPTGHRNAGQTVLPRSTILPSYIVILARPEQCMAEQGRQLPAKHSNQCGSNRDNVRHIKPVISPYTKLI